MTICLTFVNIKWWDTLILLTGPLQTEPAETDLFIIEHTDCTLNDVIPLKELGTVKRND